MLFIQHFYTKKEESDKRFLTTNKCKILKLSIKKDQMLRKQTVMETHTL